jgi:hypothetical protein
MAKLKLKNPSCSISCDAGDAALCGVLQHGITALIGITNRSLVSIIPWA